MAEIRRATAADDFTASSAVAAATCAALAALKVLIDGFYWSGVTVPVITFIVIELVLGAIFFLVRPRLVRFGGSHGRLKAKTRHDRGEQSIPAVVLLSVAAAPAIAIALVAMSVGRWREGALGIGLGASAGATILAWRVVFRSRIG
jgi:hypothetical protein